MTNNSAIAPRPLFNRPWMAALCLGVAYAVCNFAGLIFVRPPENISFFWPPTGVLLAGLILTPRKRWGEILFICLAVSYALNLWKGYPIGLSMAFTAANGADAFLAAGITTWLTKGPVRLGNLRHVMILGMLGALTGSLVSATIATTALHLYDSPANALAVWPLWWVTTYCSSLVFGSAIILLAEAFSRRGRWNVKVVSEGIVVHALLAASTLIVFSNPPYFRANALPALYLCFPFIIWAAIRLRPLGAALAVLLLTVVGTGYTALGYGPIQSIEGPLQLKSFWLQVFLVITSLSSLILAAVIEERRQSEKELLRREHLLRVSADAAHRLLRAKAWREEIPVILEELGQGLDVSRAYIFENHRGEGGELLMSQTFEWTAPDITPELDNPLMQNLCLQKDGYLNWFEGLRSGECIRGHTRLATGVEKDFLEPQGIKSYLGFPIVAGGEWWGHMGFDDCQREREWTDGELGILRTAAESLGATIHRKQADLALRESELRFRLLAENIPGVIYMCDDDAKFTMRYLNDQIFELTGYGKEELLNKDVAFADLIHPEDLNDVRLAISEATRKREAYHLVYRLKRRDGQFVWAEEFGAGVFGSSEEQSLMFLQGFIRDITERMRGEEALKDSEERYRLLADYATDMISRHDATPEARYLFVTPSCVTLLGFAPDDLVGRSSYEFIHPDDRERIRANQKRLMEDVDAGNAEYRIRKSDGSYCWVETGARVRRDEETGKITDIIAVTRDITLRRRMEENQRAIQEKIQQAQKLESLGVLAGGIAHDFNNLLVGILGAAGLALMDLSPESPARDTLLQIETSAQRAADLTRQMLAYSGKGRFVVEEINLSKLVEEMAHLLKVSINKNVVLKLDLGKSLPSIEADATQLRQIVMNLIINASEAIGEASGVIAVHTGVMQCDRDYLAGTYLDEEQDEGYYTYVEVADTGCGMDEETRGRIFDPFYTTKTTGRGLGLGAVLGIVRSHKGFIKVYSEVGRGTTFKVGFPSKSDPVEPAASSVPAMAQVDGRLSGTVLVVDDEETVRTIIKRILEREGLTILTAKDGEAGIESFRAYQDAVSLVLLDITMPGKSGEDVFREIRQITPKTPIVLMSGYSEQFIASRFYGKGPSGFLQKPFRMAQILELVKSFLPPKQ